MSEHTFEVWDDPSLAFVRMTRYNPPGLRALTYRGAPYHEALARMLANLPGQKSPHKPGAAPLGQLNIADRHDWTVALLQAWAAVLDVLTFYQERVTNEGYLNTALEDRSILELTQAIGYTIPPGISAGTHLAFTVTKRPDQPHQVALLPAGLAVQSTAIPGWLSQQFETSEPFEARSEWNALKPTRYHDVRWCQVIQEDTTKLRLQGLQTGLSVGDRLVIVSQPWLYQLTRVDGENPVVVKWQDEYLNPVERELTKVKENNLSREDTRWILIFEDKKFKPEVSALLVKLTTVNAVPASGTTVVSWDDPIEGPVVVELGGSQWGLEIGDQLLVVGSAHGHLDPDAPRLLGSVSAVQAEPGFNRTTVYLEQNPRHKRGQRVIFNPRVLALRQKAALFTYTSSGLFANTGRDKAWQPEGIGLPDARVRDILRYPSGPLFAATARGLFRSVDEGATWQALSIGLVSRDVYTLTLTKQDHLLVGTDKGGIFLSKDRGDTWHALSGESVGPYARGLRKWFPQFYTLESLPKVAVRDLITYPCGRIESAMTDVGLARGIIGWLFGGAKDYVIAAATDVGVFRSTDGGRSWRTANHALPNRDKKTGLTDTVVSALATAKGKQLFAATSAGVYHILNRPRSKPGTTIRNILIFAVAFYLFNRQLLAALASAKGPLYGLINWLSGSAGIIGQSVDWYVSELITMTTGTKAILIIGTLALLSLLAAIGYWNQYLDARERTGIAAHTLLAIEMDGVPKGGDRLYAGTQAGVFQAVSSSKLLRLLGRPVSAWQPINLASPLFLIKNTDKKREDLNEQHISDELRADFNQYLETIPPEVTIEVFERDKCWFVRGEDRQVLVTIRQLDRDYLLVYQGMLTPVGVLPQKLQAALDKAEISPEMRVEFDRLGIMLQDSRNLFVATPEMQWYVLNDNDVPVYEIWRIDERLVVMKAQVVHALDRDEAGNLLAGTASGELHRWLEGLWRRSGAGLALTDIDKIKTVGDIQFVAGIPPEGSTESGWGSSHLRERWIDLDRVYPALRPGSLLVLQQNEPWYQAIYLARRVTVVDSADLQKTGQFTRVEVDNQAGLEAFNRNLTSVRGQSEPLALHDDRPVLGKILVLDHAVPGLSKGKRLILRGKPMRSRMVAKNLAPLKALATSATAPMNLREVLKILKVDPCPKQPEKRTWRLENADRFVGTVEAGFDKIVLEPAADDDSFVNELVELVDIAGDAGQTELILKKPLGTCYDHSTVMILANVVPATHGQTIADEVLGSGQEAVSYERLRLRQQPLTYLPSAVSSDAVSTLRVYVNGVEWQQEPFFSPDLQPDDRVYVLHGDERGGSTIIFGDGINGARLPPNTEQVTASYRIGSGSSGNVPAGSLANLRTRVANLQDVINPLPTTGGVEREPRRLTRQNAPLQARASQRIVSLTDYEDFTAACPGIGKAHADLVMRGNRQVICITVAGHDGQPIPTGSMLFDNLRQALDTQRARPLPAVEIQTFSPVYFNVKAKLFIHRVHWKRAEEIERAARDKLAASFGFGQRDLGQVVTTAELIAVLHEADSAITGVEVTGLTRTDDGSAMVAADQLRPQDARELLMINAEGENGIDLTLNFEEML